VKQNISAGTAAIIVVVVLAVVGFAAYMVFGPKKAAPPPEAEINSAMKQRDPNSANQMSEIAKQKAMEHGAVTTRPGMPRSGPGMGGGQGSSAPTSMPPGPR